MTLFKKEFLPILGLFFLISTSFRGIYGLNCYSCSSIENCAKNIQRITCKESEINCETKLDTTNAIISKSCAETCEPDANCCNSDLCNMIVAFDDAATTATADSTTSKESTEASTLSSHGSSDSTSSASEGSSDTTQSSSESTITTASTPATTTQSHTNSGTPLTMSVFGIGFGIVISLLSLY